MHTASAHICKSITLSNPAQFERVAHVTRKKFRIKSHRQDPQQFQATFALVLLVTPNGKGFSHLVLRDQSPFEVLNAALVTAGI